MHVPDATADGPCEECVRIIDVPTFLDDRGALTSAEARDVGFDIARVFVVAGEPGAERGGHAHVRGRQVLMLASGRVAVDVVTHGRAASVTLPDDGRALALEPGVWARQRYLGPGSALAVLCDGPYDPTDYTLDPEPAP
ncbi:FdtA/QdtA family cupin domain-containing protein [Microbacter sp. GSS18]|nr:FdtA/QdtA family cupin domain-containing protein [Microbacter sp. GSS18]